jgi:hypothetical protein
MAVETKAKGSLQNLGSKINLDLRVCLSKLMNLEGRRVDDGEGM